MSSYVYFIEAMDGSGIMKIGKSKNPKDRLRALQFGSYIHLRIAGLIDCESCESAEILEKKLHHENRDKWVGGEWYKDVNPSDYGAELVAMTDRDKFNSEMWGRLRLKPLSDEDKILMALGMTMSQLSECDCL